MKRSSIRSPERYIYKYNMRKKENRIWERRIEYIESKQFSAQFSRLCKFISPWKLAFARCSTLREKHCTSNLAILPERNFCIFQYRVERAVESYIAVDDLLIHQWSVKGFRRCWGANGGDVFKTHTIVERPRVLVIWGIDDPLRDKFLRVIWLLKSSRSI